MCLYVHIYPIQLRKGNGFIRDFQKGNSLIVGFSVDQTEKKKKKNIKNEQLMIKCGQF